MLGAPGKWRRPAGERARLLFPAGGGIVQADGAVVKVNVNQAVLPGDSLQNFGDHFHGWFLPFLHQWRNMAKGVSVFGQFPVLHQLISVQLTPGEDKFQLAERQCASDNTSSLDID